MELKDDIVDIKEFAVCLAITLAEAKRVEIENPRRVGAQLVDLLDKWFKSKERSCWEEIVNALICLKYNQLANKLKLTKILH